ncbi:MAG: hypothetical protein ACPGUE_14670 [Marinomonas sp.]
MSLIKTEFEELGIELFSDFEVGQDPRENITLENPCGFHPVTGPLPGVTKSGRFFPASYDVREVNNSISTGDTKGIFLTSEWSDFDINVNTKAIDDTGQKFEVLSINPSPKDVIITVQLRKI